MVFNIFAHNRDDHIKNFAFIMDDATGEWSLSPAYDLTYAVGPGGEHTMTVAGEGKAPDIPHILELAKRSSISQKAAKEIIDEVASVISRKLAFAAKSGVSRKSINSIFRNL